MTTKKCRASTNYPRIKTCLLAVVTGLTFVFDGFSQAPPPNDNYSNSIVLTDTDITFTGTLAGATVENTQETVAPGTVYVPATQSVWWTWIAPTDTVLTLQIVSCSYLPSPFATVTKDAVAVYSATNGSSSPDGLILPALCAMPVLPQLAPQTLSIPVTGGSNYQIQLVGSSSSSYTLRLIATNTPAIVTQPRSQTVDSNACATFYVVSAGISQSSFTFEWFLNGTNLPNETAPILALTNITSSMTGAYTVAVSNSAGVTISSPAMLAIGQSNFPVSLTAVGLTITNFQPAGGPNQYISNVFLFSVAGEKGRSYRLQASTNLTNWTSEADFALGPNSVSEATSVFLQTNSSQIVAVPNFVGPRFFRLTPYVTAAPDAAICINNLRQIRIARMLWQRDYNDDHNWAPSFLINRIAAPLASDITPYFPHQTPPFCPDDFQESFDTSYHWQNAALEENVPCMINPARHYVEDPQ